MPETIQIELALRAGEYVVSADATRVRQVIMNLCINARDAMPDGGDLRIGLERIRLEAGEALPEPEMEPGDWMRLTVADSGTGISDGDLDHIFEPFFTTKGFLAGTGLGLAQVHGIVKQHEGHIGVTTEEGKGTTFSIYLPAVQVSEPEALEPQTVELVKGLGQTVLVVEDNAATRAAVVSSLEGLNYRVLEAPNGVEGLKVFEQHRQEIALVLSDVVMPEMGGAALSRALAERGCTAPVLLLSGYPLNLRSAEMQLPGVVDWLQKPVELGKLAQAVARAVGRET